MTPMSRVARRLATFMLTIFALQLGCGDGEVGDDVVYFHIYNGYAGSAQMSLYGPTGALVNSLPFGQSTLDVGNGEPVAFDRSLPGNFTLLLDGSPKPISLPSEAWSLYPHETATLFLIRRQGENALLQMYRHVRSISEGCRIVFGNALSTPSANLGEYNFMAGFTFDDIATAGYLASDPRGGTFLTEVRDNPYFFLVQSEEEETEGVLIPVWVGPKGAVDFPRVDFKSGTVTTAPPTSDVVTCIADAAGDPTAEAECELPKSYQGIVFTPEVEHTFIHYFPENFGNSGGDCSARFRIFSDFSNIFTGEHANGSFIDGEVSGNAGDHLFWVLYGFPAGNPGPRIAQWSTSDDVSAGGFQPLPDYPSTP
ncbi:hypothetical protein FRC91_09425 [Bradymonadales bacterium TMQ1]|nr:hypothetical protein FRC91_09425 [Bradymonadales bacterium TMQ1]